MRDRLVAVAQRIYREKYPEADVLFLCGSVVREENTATSDLDVVVLYDTLPHSYRDSYYFEDWPVEAFVHDMDTMRYFFVEVDRPSGIPSLMQMVSEGIEIPDRTKRSALVKKWARQVIEAGPEPWTKERIDRSRYAITDIVDDLSATRDHVEKQAILIRLYEQFAEHFFRARGEWSAKGKWIPRRMYQVDPSFAKRYLDEVDRVFQGGHPDVLLALIEEELKAHGGGFLFEGYRLDAPVTWRHGQGK